MSSLDRPGFSMAVSMPTSLITTNNVWKRRPHILWRRLFHWYKKEGIGVHILLTLRVNRQRVWLFWLYRLHEVDIGGNQIHEPAYDEVQDCDDSPNRKNRDSDVEEIFGTHACLYSDILETATSTAIASFTRLLPAGPQEEAKAYDDDIEYGNGSGH